MSSGLPLACARYGTFSQQARAAAPDRDDVRNRLRSRVMAASLTGQLSQSARTAPPGGGRLACMPLERAIERRLRLVAHVRGDGSDSLIGFAEELRRGL